VAGGATAASALTDLLYRGEAFDASTKLQYLRARFYDASQGRFTSLDPYQGDMRSPMSQHGYMYAHANAVSHGDPSGMFIEYVGTLAVAGIQALLRVRELPVQGAALAYARALLGTAALQSAIYLYQAYYFPSTADALDRLASEEKHFSPTNAGVLRTVARGLRYSFVESSLVLTQSVWLTTYPNLATTNAVVRGARTALSMIGIYETLRIWITITMPSHSISAASQLAPIRLIGNAALLRLDPVVDIDTATTTLRAVRQLDYAGGRTSFQALWR
jgi:RHS repeat-associated protein